MATVELIDGEELHNVENLALKDNYVKFDHGGKHVIIPLAQVKKITKDLQEPRIRTI